MRLGIRTAARFERTGRPLATRLALQEVGRQYGAIRALDHISLDVTVGEVLCLLGPSGSGKSTLLRLIAGVERPTSGRILIDGADVADPRGFVEPEARRIGMVFQDYALFPHLTVAGNVAFGLRGRRRAEIDALVETALDRFDLRRYATSYPHQLSGGERQRVALARAMAPSPRVLLMDEPFSSLDDRLRDHVRQQTLDILRETGTTTLIVTHDPNEAMGVADRIALLQAGRLVQCGTPAELYASPATLFAARFFSDINELRGTCRNGCVETPLGCFPAPHLADHTVASVCIRPQHLRLAPRPTAIPARVLRTAFLGEVDHLTLAVAGLDAPLTLRAFGRTAVEPEDTVYLQIEPQDVLVVPQGHGDRPRHPQH